ncbi:MAG: hypothetical protein WCH99_08125 [Verrucomicrobiota bacterium]
MKSLLLLPLILLPLVANAAETTNHAELLKKIPEEFITRIGGALPDKNGFIGHNRAGFKGSGFQRGATLTLAIAAARGDRKRAEDCWRAVEVTFARQKEAGHFGDPPTSVAFWLCELCRSLLVVQQSLLAKDYQERIAILLPKLRKSADWLATQQAALIKADGDTPNRLLFSAEAFGFAGILLQDEKLVAAGKDFLNRSLKLYRDVDGVFLEHGGGDSSYQAVNLLRLQEIVIHFPDPKLEAAIRQGMKWELNRIAADGTVSTEGNTRVRPGGEKFMGTEKQVNVGEVTLALLYFHLRTGDAEALAAAQRIRAHYTK